MTSLLSLSFDVLENCIFKRLDYSSLVACSFVNLRVRRLNPQKRLARILTRRNDRQYATLQDIFKYGFVYLLRWFQAVLRYPSILSLSVSHFDKYMNLAASGKRINV